MRPYLKCVATLITFSHSTSRIFIITRLAGSSRCVDSVISDVCDLCVCLSVSALCVCVCVGRQGSLALAGSLSRRRKTLIQNRG